MTAPTDAWDEFGEALRYELGRLGDGILLVISSKDKPWQVAQFAQYLDRLFAEVSGETVENPPGAREDTPEGRRILEAHGWQAPVYRDGYQWHRFVAYPPTAAEYREIVDGVVSAFRDVNGVPGPERLTYNAWEGKNGNKHWPVELPGVEYRPY